MYHVTRQSYFYDDGAHAVEIALGRDNISPGAYAAYFDGDFVECDDPREAAEVAIKLRSDWFYATPVQRKKALFTISTDASLGLYPTVADAKTAKELREWAQRLYEQLPKCAACGAVARTEWMDHDTGETIHACDESCANKVFEEMYDDE